MSKESLKNELERKVTAVWFIQGNKRFLMNWFYTYETARSYVKGFSHFKINGEILIGEVALKNLIEEGGKENA